MTRPRTLAAVATLAVAGAVLGGCSSHPATPPGSTTTSSTTAAGPTSTSTSSTSSVAAGSHCAASQLTVSVLGTQGAAGTLEVTLQLKNSASTTCTLQGYPGTQLYDANGAPLPTTTVPAGSYSFTNFSPSLVTLAPGALAYVNLGYSDVPSGSGACPTAASMWLTPPGAADHAVVTQQLVVCGGKITVSPVFGQGSPETQTTAPAHP